MPLYEMTFDADPRSARLRYDGRESKFVAAIPAAATMALLRLLPQGN